MIGKTISHYKILEKLGEGGMGVVYKAEDTKLGRAVALKFLPPELTRDPQAKERFVHEAQAASALDHPNICNIHEIDETNDGRMFIAMACYEGESLKTKIEHGPFKLDDALDVALQAAQGLAKAHDQGIIHRDIKPANILITKDGLVKIVDFGLAKLAGTKVTKTGTTLGTAQYMSPEQARGEEVDARSDIFSLGTVLYEMLTRKHAFPGEYEQATIYSILNQEPEPVTALRSGVPLELDRIIKKALAKQPRERYQHADDLIVDLKECAAKSISARRKESALSPRGKRRPGLRFWIPAAFVVSAVLLVILLNPFNFEIGFKKTVAAERKSVAVLPFTNMSGDKEDEFFSDGITEDIIAQLSNIAELKVISRTSVMRYKNTIKSMREIARELNVATILEGSVRRSGNQVRIVAQLIDATNDEHVWAQTYDKEITQIFAIQSDVAQQIASALQAKLSPRERERLGKKPTNSIDAYALYLKGREYYYRYIKRDNEYAIELFKEALALDSSYALAYAGLGDAYAQRTSRFGFPSAWVDSSIVMSGKAIAIDPTLAEAYKALGLGYYQKRWIRRSIETYRKAIELNPKYWPAVGNIGDCNMIIGKFDEALLWYKRALPLNPMFPFYYWDFGEVYTKLDDCGKAVEWYNKALALQPDFIPALLGLGWIHIRRGEYQQAIDQVQKVLSIQPDYPAGLDLAGSAELLRGNLAEAERYLEKGIAVDSAYGPNTDLGYVHWKTGRKDQARKLFARSLTSDSQRLERGGEDPAIPYDLARLNAIQGDEAESYKWLQKAIDAGWRDYRYGEIDPLLENLHNDDRFKQMMAGVKEQVNEMRKRIEEAEKEETGSGPQN